MATMLNSRLNFRTFSNVINGKLESTTQTRHGINPATVKPNPEVPLSTIVDIDVAVAAAKVAFQGWSATPYSRRQAAIRGFADALEEEKEGFAEMLTAEQGKPVSSCMAKQEPILSLTHMRSSNLLVSKSRRESTG
jgi:acyl-CoA reductase-like NAD-dependent aldehyde dehydrogenase